MDIGGVIESSAARAAANVQPGAAIQDVRDDMQKSKELVAEILSSGQQISSQVYDGHGQVVPTPAGSNVDMQG